MPDYFCCPNCGAEVPIEAKACPECGSDEKTGWSEDTMYDDLDLPEHEDEAEKSSGPLFKNKYLMYIVIIITILAFIWLYIF